MKKNCSLTVRELPAGFTPDRLPPSLFNTPYFFFLDSSLSGPSARYSIAAWDPVCVIEATEGEDFFKALREAVREFPAVEAPDLPFAGGWIGYLGYEAYSYLEKKVPARRPDLIPKAVFCFYDRFYLYDHLKRRACRASLETGGGSGLEDGEESRRRLRGPSPVLISNFSQKEYLSAIQRIKNYIAAGDCYQVNLSQKFSCEVTEDPRTIYQRLRKTSPAPYSAYLNLGGAQILSSSPECFLEVNGREVVTRPIKGTRPRGGTPEEDERLKRELAKSVKDHAELLMITDLERNDLGRVCRAGSITVPGLCVLESYAQVHHLVATIRGELDQGKDTVDLLRAAFPGGSITGAPKVRAMQIIHELERDPRNVYCGTIGFLSLNGKARFNIAIRTMILKNQRANFWAGGGIVADSDPEAEYEETLAKARGMIEALDPDRPGRLNNGLNNGLKEMREEEPRHETGHDEHIVDPDRVEVA